MKQSIQWFVKGVGKQIDKVYFTLKPYNTWILNKRYPAQTPNPKAIPIIINNRNRYTFLLQLIEALELRGYTNIHILDNDSDYPPLLEYYARTKHSVHFLKANLGHIALWRSGLIKQFESGYFVYTDPDVVPIDSCPDNFMELFLEVMHKYPLVEKVGFGLAIDDLPDCFEKKEEVIQWEQQFWVNPISENPPLFRAAIDTTFALYRPWYKLGGWLKSPNIRTGYPYVASHKPWYNDSSHLSEEELYYISHCQTISHWIADSYKK
ncbi:MAG: glycosyltransferase family 2 protein [Tannerellaceae bacterium]